jgi:hypothetical protein
MILDHGLNDTTGLPSADLTTLTGHVCMHLKLGNWNLPWMLAHRLYFVPGQHPANATEGHADKWQKGN